MQSILKKAQKKPSTLKSEELLSGVKKLYEEAVTTDSTTTTPLPTIYTEGFGSEQIWEQLQLLNKPVLQRTTPAVATANKVNGAKIAPVPTNPEESSSSNGDDEDDMSGSDDFAGLEELEGLEEETGENSDDDDEDQDDFEEDMPSEQGDEDNLDEDDEDNLPKSSMKKRKSPVDDAFFSLQDMEDFAERAEARDMKRARTDKVDDDDEFDLGEGFLGMDPDQLHDSDQEDDDDDEDLERMDAGDDNANDIMYEDFFGPRETASRKPQKAFTDKMSRKLSRENRNEYEKLKEDTNIAEGLEDEDDEDEEEPTISSKKPSKITDIFNLDDPSTSAMSNFEKDQARLSKQIATLEAEAMAPKHWALTGEISAKHRPVDSLLQEVLDIEPGSKPVPIPTEETTIALEDLIKQRIRDSAFDDVERKAPAVEKTYDPNRRFELNESKPNKSLAEEYESEYLKQTMGNTPTVKDAALKASHDEISTLFKSLCNDLDVLSNWHFAPKPARDELTVMPLPSVPAISLEEAIPAGVSDGQLAAPKEVYSGKTTKGASEMEASDKKRIRTTKQRLFKRRKVEKAQRERDLEALAKKSIGGHGTGKKLQKAALEQLMHKSNVTIIGDSKVLKGGKDIRNKGAGKRKLADIVERGGSVKSKKNDTSGMDGNMLRL
ncbi:hypothetical protein SmJEL517_g02919 [Synchytrium microbalum]|uniref:U3 small nucleolar ribonucleoprotein protein MPP10 n=1 Tax=Synchytrium microbalum TaxID=1806994 RepID=A0A507BYT5_9FUNG|nr:uncharacterized protein SmJEL517_g02919 [Synchytrium microbalum]TPX34450.1 hypothetical protein SmJEL517_g02919 [Synchytrium microbalum]